MPIRLPPLKATPSILADWVEMRTLADPSGFFRLNNLKRFWDTNRETEASDPGGQYSPEEDTDSEGVSGYDDDAFLDAVNDELSERLNALKESYPFSFDSQGSGLRFKINAELSEGAKVYLFCLLLTHWGADEVMDGTWTPNIDNKTRDLFQACATLAAAGFISGCAISFGWPRPNGNPPFLKKLREVYALFGEGQVVASIKPGASPMVKDEEIDIIAWKPRVDKAPGTHYMLGQVASGDNWESKSLMGGIDYFHRAWFISPPVSEAKASIFIPHMVQQVGTGNRNDRMELLHTKFGYIIDRMVLPHYLREGMSFCNDPSCKFLIERSDAIPFVIDWVNQQTEGLRSAGEVPL